MLVPMLPRLLGVFVALGSLGGETRVIVTGGAVLLVDIGFGVQRLADSVTSGVVRLSVTPVLQREVDMATSTSRAA
jgi:hypothetical protein